MQSSSWPGVVHSSVSRQVVGCDAQCEHMDAWGGVPIATFEFVLFSNYYFKSTDDASTSMRTASLSKYDGLCGHRVRGISNNREASNDKRKLRHSE